MNATDYTNVMCFCILIVISVLVGKICRSIWKEKWIPSLVWIICVDLAGLFLLIYRLMIL